MTHFDATNDLATHSLELVQRELNETLDAARREIEGYVDGQATPDALTRAAQHLHLAGGALRIVEIYGAALLADEMEQTCAFLTESRDTGSVEKGVQALTRSMVQLPAYLDRLLSGGRDVALVLLPLINDLRSARGRPLMSEGTLLLLKTGPLERSRKLEGAGKPVAVDDDFARMARRQRPAFQSALLGWIRGEHVEHNLDELVQISSTLEQAATSKYVQQFWGVLSAVLVALRAQGLEAGVALKRLIGQADRQLRRLSEAGESELIESPPAELLNNLLYYVARAKCDDERVQSIRSEFGLNDLVPGEDQLQEARASLAGPSIKLMRTVAIAIKQDLGTVKDSLDIFVRTGMQDFRQLVPQLEMLAKIGDTLGVLGLDKAQATIEAQVRELNEIADSGEGFGEGVLEGIAAVILGVEDELDQELIRAVLPTDSEDAQESEARAQFNQVAQAVMTECIANMARVKEAVTRLVEKPDDSRPLEQITPQLRGIAAGLLMLNKTAAVRLIERVGAVISAGFVKTEDGTAIQSIERLADAIVSIEYYMETVSAGRKDPWYMLENAARCLELLERRRAKATDAGIVAEPAASEPSAASPAPATREVGARPQAEPAEEPQREVAETSAGARAGQRGLDVLQVLDGGEERSDPELLEVFIEEAKGEIEKIATNLPIWLSDTQNSEALIATRRSFHTLKGSGRTVGANAIGEFSWSIENLLNRLINRTLRLSPAATAFIAEAAEALPQIVDELELGIPAKVDVAELCARADALAAGEVPVAGVEKAAQEEAAGPPPVPATHIDPVLAEIFVKEIRGHLAVLRTYIENARRSHSPSIVGDDVYRASHTLLGSANMANYEPCLGIVEPLAEYLRHCFEAKRAVSYEGVEIIASAADAVESMADALLNNVVETAPHELLDSLNRLVASIGTEAATKASVAHLDIGEPLAESARPAEPVSEATVESVGFDPEIAGIFADEAAEILDQTELAFEELRSGGNGQAAVGELQRLLHTLKGGARMAGLIEMGNLSHAVETLLSALADGRRPSDAGAVRLVQRSLDALHLMRDAVDAGAPLADSSQLQAALQQAAEGGDAVTAAEETPLESASEELSREEILVQSTARPLDFDFSAKGLGDTAEFDMRTSILPGQDAWDVGAPDIELTGTIEFSDEEMAKLQRLAFADSEASEAETNRPEGAREAGISKATHEPDEIAANVAPEPAPEPEPEPEPEVAIEPEPETPVEFEAALEAELALEPRPEAEHLEPAALIEPEPEPIAAGPAELEPLEFAAAPKPEVEPAVAPFEDLETALPRPRPAGLTAPPPADSALGTAAAGRPQPAFVPEPALSEARAAERVDTARVSADLLDELLNSSGEISIFQARLNQQLHSIDFHLNELGATVTRLREQLRKLEAETEAEILHRHQDDAAQNKDFDPLELDRYSTIQQLSRALAETANDVASINELLQGLTTEADTLLTQQGRVTAEIQDGLMQTRMVPFQRHVPRLSRVVRQVAADTGKNAELGVIGAESELDRHVLESMLPPLEHLLRNSVVHGIELPDVRRQRGKPETGRLNLAIKREGSEVSIEVSDDGGGLNIEAIRRTAVERGLIADNERITASQAAELILQPGFSTAGELTQAAGRGVGMDIVDNELKKLGGSMHIETTEGQGTRFAIRLPYTLAITHALIVDVGEETFALPLTTVEGITRVRREHLLELLTEDEPHLEYGDLSYRIQHLGSLVGGMPSALPEDESAVALVLVRAGESSTALLMDSLEGSREVVVKGLGPHIGSIPGVTGATILGDGRVIMILDVGTLIRRQPKVAPAAPVREFEARELTALVVDDSITMRRVTERLLERRGIKVVTARDGLDAITVLQESDPDIILLDIEMPRMDGYQFAAHVRNDARFRNLPIIMITSRSGQKHRAKAIEVGVNEYLSKPYQEAQLIAAMQSLLGREL